MAMTSLHISLSETLKAFVGEQVKEGGFSNPSDYVRALIRADRERQAKLEALRCDLDEGLADLEAGRVVDGEEVLSRLRERYGSEA